MDTPTRILIVEDEGLVVEDIKGDLENMGYQVLGAAASGDRALQMADELRPDLVLMDIKLSGQMDGVEVAGQIWERLDIPVVYTSAYAGEDILQRAKLSAPFGYLHKPLDPRELRSAIEVALYRHAAEKRLRESLEQVQLAEREIQQLNQDLEYLYQNERAQRQMAETLSQVGATLAATLDVDAVLDLILKLVERVVPHDASNIMLTSPPRPGDEGQSGEIARVVRWRGYERFGAAAFIAAYSVPLDRPSLQQQIAQTGQATAVPDVQVDPNWSEVPPQMAWLRSFAGAPICVRDRVIGFLNVGSATPGAFDQAKAERLRAFADQAAVALENARLFSMLSREREQLALLYRLGRQVSESLDVHVVAQWALDGLCAITGAAQGLVLVRAPDDQALYLVASLGYSLDSVAAVRQHARTWLITSLFDWFATRQRATLVNDAIRDEPWINIPGVSEVSRSVLYVPLLSSLPGMADRAVESLVGVLGLGSDQAGFFTEDARRLVESAASTVAIAIANARLYEQARREIAEREQAEDQLRQHRQQLRLLNARLSEVEDAERRRLARELHDQVGQNLSALGVSLSLVQATLLPALAGVPQRHELAASLETRLDDAQAMVKGVTTSIQGVMANLRSPVLDEYGLAAGLRWYAAQLAERTGLAVVVHGEELCPRPPTSVESALFRIAQEALTNVVKHARAQQAVVSLERDGKTLRMIVADDGQGFDPAILAKPQHWGILSMQERAEAAGGCCQVESRLGWGTRVVVEVVL